LVCACCRPRHQPEVEKPAKADAEHGQRFAKGKEGFVAAIRKTVAERIAGYLEQAVADPFEVRLGAGLCITASR